MGLKMWFYKYKTEASIYLKNPKRYPFSKIDSYIPNGLKIGEKVTIKKGVSFSNTLKKIGSAVYIGDRTTLLNVSEIGSYSCISHNVKIGLDNHKLDAISTNPIFYKDQLKKHISPTIIEADVLISADVTVLSGLKLGVGCVVGANSFVNKDIPPYAIVAGSPAKVISYRFEKELIEDLLTTKWWEKSLNELEAYRTLFTNPNEFVKAWNKNE